MTRRQGWTWFAIEIGSRVAAVLAFGFTFLHPSRHPGPVQYVIAIAAFVTMEIILIREDKRRHVEHCEQCQETGYQRHQ